MTNQPWAAKTREAKLASVLYPGNASTQTQRDMARLAKREGKRAPGGSALLEHSSRGATSPLDGRARS
jgi:hypothetical protein